VSVPLETTCRAVPRVAPNATLDSLVKPDPCKVTTVAPASGPVAGDTLVTTGAAT
jgi:hypothetical protein